MKVVCIHELFRDASYRHSNLFVAVEGGLQINIIDVLSHLLLPQVVDCSVLKKIDSDGVFS